jgi:hypothetical protein
MFWKEQELSPLTLTRDAIVGIRLNQWWYLGFHFSCYSGNSDHFRQEFQSLHEDEVAGSAIAIGDYNHQTGYLGFAQYHPLNCLKGDKYTYASGGENPRLSTIDAAFVRQQSHCSLIVSHDSKDWWKGAAGEWRKERLDHSFVLISHTGLETFYNGHNLPLIPRP